MSEVFERRAHPRFAVSLSVRCRRLGPRQRQMTDDVRVVDVSVGGMRVEAPSWMDVGNVVEISGDGIAVRGLVVGISPAPGAARAAGWTGGVWPRQTGPGPDVADGHTAATTSTAAAGDRHAHIAFSNTAGATIDLDRLVGRAARAS